MSMTSKRAFKKLSEAMVSRRSVRVLRSIEGADVLDGFVVAVGSDWVLLLRENGQNSVDGRSALRVADISLVTKLPKKGTPPVIERIMTANDEWPPAAPSYCDMYNLESVIATAQAISPIFAIHREVKRPGSLWIGALRSIDQRHLEYYALNPAAEWDEMDRVRIASITRIDFGTEYVSNLAKVMPPVPTD